VPSYCIVESWELEMTKAEEIPVKSSAVNQEYIKINLNGAALASRKAKKTKTTVNQDIALKKSAYLCKRS